MADASDSKSDVGDYVWVQVPSPARYGAKRYLDGTGFAPFCVLPFAYIGDNTLLAYLCGSFFARMTFWGGREKRF